MTDADNEFPFRSNNDGGFTKQELRDGIPLDYIAGKLEGALKTAHRLYREIDDVVPENLPQPDTVKGTSYNAKHSSLLFDAGYVFENALIAYLGLFNFMAVANTKFKDERSQIERLLKMDTQEFGVWVDQITRRGSLTEVSEFN